MSIDRGAGSEGSPFIGSFVTSVNKAGGTVADVLHRVSTSSNAERLSRVFSSSVNQLRESLDSVRLNPKIRSIIVVTVVLFADVCLLTITVSFFGVFVTTVVVPLALLNQSDQPSPVTRGNLDKKKIAAAVAALFADVWFLSSAMSPVSVLFLTVAVPLALFRYLKGEKVSAVIEKKLELKAGDILTLKSTDGTSQSFTVSEIYPNEKGGKFSRFVIGVLEGEAVGLKIFNTAAEMNAKEGKNYKDDYIQKQIVKEIKHLKRVREEKVDGALQLKKDVTIIEDGHRAIVTDLVGEDLLGHREKGWFNTSEKVTKVALSILRALHGMHYLKCPRRTEDKKAYKSIMERGIEHGGIVHADLKPENILMRELNKRDVQVTVIDFGLSHKNRPKAYSTKGTLEFLAPECFPQCYPSSCGVCSQAESHKSPHNEKQTSAIDMWAVGCTLFDLIGGKTGNARSDLLLNEVNKNSLYITMQSFLAARKKASNEHQEIQPLIDYFQLEIDKLIDKIPGSAGKFKVITTLIKQLLSLEPKERPTAMQAFTYLTMANCREVFQKAADTLKRASSKV